LSGSSKGKTDAGIPYGIPDIYSGSQVDGDGTHRSFVGKSCTCSDIMGALFQGENFIQEGVEVIGYKDDICQGR